MTVGTFAINGPLKCGGLPIAQYDEVSLARVFAADFQCADTFRDDHTTPSGSVQHFVFGQFRRK